jgi:shikimate dehydrogenase
MNITGKTDIYCIFGKPVEHSFSPIIQNCAFQESNLDSVYVAFEPRDIKSGMESLKTLGIKGCSVTIPFKVDVIPYLDEIDPLAEKIGAVNTLLNRNGRITGFNTDGIGAIKALKEKTTIEGKEIAVLGFGGAARAIAFTLADEKPRSITIWGLPGPYGKKLSQELETKTSIPSFFETVEKKVYYDILINATPVGMWPETDKMPVPESFLIRGKTVFDIIYRPRQTKLVQKALEKDCTVIYGYKMLLYQGVEQFEIWTDQKAPVEAMEKSLLLAVKEKD